MSPGRAPRRTAGAQGRVCCATRFDAGPFGDALGFGHCVLWLCGGCDPWATVECLLHCSRPCGLRAPARANRPHNQSLFAITDIRSTEVATFKGLLECDAEARAHALGPCPGVRYQKASSSNRRQ